MAKRKLMLYLDLDGTLAAIRREPGKAKPSKETLALLRALSKKKRVKIFIVSGRMKGFLERTLPIRNITLVGEHGVAGISAGAKRAMARVARKMAALSKKYAGSSVERKGTSLTLHYRRVGKRLQPGLEEALERGFGRTKGARVLRGKKVFELIFSEEGKGTLVKKTAKKGALVIAIGDDATDEDMFRQANTLAGISIRVGGGKTEALYSVRSIADVREILRAVLKRA